MAASDLKIQVTTTADTSGLDQVTEATKRMTDEQKNFQAVANRTGETWQQVQARFAEGPQLIGAITREAEKTGQAFTISRQEVTAFISEIVRGQASARSLGTALSAFGNPIAIAGVAMFSLVELVKQALDAQEKWSLAVEKTHEEMVKLGESILEAQDALREIALINKLPLNEGIARAREDVIKLKQEYALLPNSTEDDRKKWEEKGKEIIKAEELLDRLIKKSDSLFQTEAKIAEQADLRNAKGNEEAEIVAKVNILETDTYNTLRAQGATKEEATRYSQLAGENLRQQLETERGMAPAQREYNQALHDSQILLQGIRQQQQLIQSAPFMGADQKQVALLASYRTNLQLVEAEMAKLQTDMKGGALDPAVMEQDRQKMQQLTTEAQKLGQQIAAATHPLRAELTNWAIQFGTTMQQVGHTIEQTVGVALQGLNQWIVTGKFNLQSMMQQIEMLGLQLIEQLIIQRVMSIINANAAVGQAAVSGPLIAAAYAPAATAVTIATEGQAAVAAPAEYATALLAIQALSVAHEGGSISDLMRLHSGGLAPDEVPIIAQTGEFMIQRSVAQQPGMMDYLSGLNEGAFHSGGWIRRMHKGGASAWQPGQPITFGGTPSSFTSPTGQGPLDNPLINPLDMPDLGPDIPDLNAPPFAHTGPYSHRELMEMGQDPMVARFLNEIYSGPLGFTPPAGTPGFLQGPTMIPTYFDPQGYPMAVPVEGYPSSQQFHATSGHHAPKHSGGPIGRMHSGGSTKGGGAFGAPQVHVYAFTDLKALTKHMGSREGQKIIFDTVQGRRIDLGLK